MNISDFADPEAAATALLAAAMALSAASVAITAYAIAFVARTLREWTRLTKPPSDT